MIDAINVRAAAVSETVFAASRQVWLAGLGAAVVTREWADKEAGTVFRKLVREGTVVESRAFRLVGDRLDSSFSQANVLWKHARRTVVTTAKSLADATSSLVRQSLPASASVVATKRTARPVKRSAKRARKAAPTRTPAKQTKRATKRVAKGG